jgi:hypothetical protein
LIFFFCIWFRIRMRTIGATLAVVISALVCLYCFMRWFLVLGGYG